jgi:hypothetical protein
MKKKIFLLLAAAFVLFGSGVRSQDLGGPGKIFQKSYKEDIKGFFLAKSSGDLLVYGGEWVQFFDPKGNLLWEKTGFKYVCGGGVSRDGNTILFQTSAEPKTQQTTTSLTVHLVDRTGKELLSQPNPYRYFTSILSSNGTYIVFGDQMAKKIYVLDRSLQPLWERETWLWYIGFDADDQFVFDSTSGLVMNNQGRRVWELPSGTRILSISTNADILVSQPFLTAKNKNQIYVTARKTAQQALLEGYSAGVSQDGSLIAYEDMKRKVSVYHTQELLDKMNGNQTSATPLWTDGVLYQVKQLHFSKDNSKLFVYGETTQQNVKFMEIDLSKGKNIWTNTWVDNPPLLIWVTEDGRYLATQKSSQFEYFGLK